MRIQRLFLIINVFLLMKTQGFAENKVLAEKEVIKEISSEKVLPPSRDQLQMSFSPVVKKVTPAVVNIYAAKMVRSRTSPFLEDPVFRHFFGDIIPEEQPHARIQKSLGSGVIVRNDGLVITNLHVVNEAEEVKVVLNDGREFEADIIVRDQRTDVAALKLRRKDKKELPHLDIRDADELEVGDVVLAVGNPFGLGQTVTMGIVSGLARTQVGIDDFRSLIQTDAAINPGNSGGPLVTLDGKVVGINTAIFSNSGGSIGIGFAIPSNLLVPIIASADHGGKIRRVWAGITMQNVDQEIAKALGLEKISGIIVKAVFDNSPAKKAGIEVGDLILELNGHEVKNETAFRFRIASIKEGSSVKVKLQRKGSVLEKDLILETPPDFDGNKQVRLVGRHPLSGAVVIGLSPAVASELGMGFGGGGVVILSVTAGSPASFAGFMPGDVVLKINDAEIKTIGDIEQNLKRSKRGWIIVSRRGESVRRLIVENG